MGLRKLTEKSSRKDAAQSSDRARRDASARRFSPEPRRDGAAPNPDAAEHGIEDSARFVGTDLQTPPPAHAEFPDVDAEAADTAPHSKTARATTAAVPAAVDPFTAALEALRSTLRTSTLATTPPPAATQTQTVDTAVVAPEIPVDSQSAKIEESESASALENTPLPTFTDTTIPAELQTLSNPESPKPRRQRIERAIPEQREAPSMDSALRAVRDAVPGLNLTPPKSDTPAAGKKRPSSDGIPKSVSEDLPKYPARPRMRTCNRCGRETKLRDAKCQKCGHVDESLGILDAVIAGDLARVEQILLVRPHLITLRTSRHDWTLLHMAASGGNPKMVELLIDKGAPVNSANRDGKTPLHYAAGKGHAGIVRTLLKHLADPQALYDGKSALDLARKNGHREVEDLLRQ